MMAAVLADVSEVVGKIRERQKEQDITNVHVGNKIDRNTGLLNWYNRGVWTFSGAAVLWGLERFLTSL